MSREDSVQILPLSAEHVSEVARLHMTGISEGFLSSLGEKFLCCLYGAAAESEMSFGYVAVDKGKVLGFVSCAESTGGLYKAILKKYLHKLLWACLPAMLKPRNIKHALETLFYPARVEGDLPSAELLSIVVSQEARGLGLGRKLVEACSDEFRRRGIGSFKAMVFEKFPSNSFYQRVGFKSVGKYCQHGSEDIHDAYVLKIAGENGTD